MRSDKYKNREMKSNLPRDSWEETQLLFQNRDREKAAQKRREDFEAKRDRDAIYQEYLAMRKNPDANRSPEHAARSAQPEHREHTKRKERVMRSQQPERRERASRAERPAEAEYVMRSEYAEQRARASQMPEKREALYSSEYERDRQRVLQQMEHDAYEKERIKKKQPILAEEPDRYEKKEQRQNKAKRRREVEEYNRIRQEEAKAQGKGKKKHKKVGIGRKDGNGGGHNKGDIKRIAAIILLGIAVLLLGGFLFVNAMLTRVGDLDLDKSALGIDPAVSENLGDYRNILLLGVDARDMNDYDHCRTDAIIIMSIDNKNDEVRQISVYRDTYLYTDEAHGYDKITNVHSKAGTEATIKTLNQNMDLNIDEVVLVNWKVVADTVDGLGGIEVDVLESEVAEMNKYIPDTQANIGGSGDLIEAPGLQTLNGNQAVTYARIRKDHAQGDYRRNERMKIVLSATIDKAKRTNPVKLNRIANTVLPQIKTNMSNTDMMGIMMAVLTKDMTGSTGWPFTVTGWSNGAWYGVPATLNTNVIQLHEQYFGQPGYVPTETVKEISKNIEFKTGVH